MERFETIDEQATEPSPVPAKTITISTTYVKRTLDSHIGPSQTAPLPEQMPKEGLQPVTDCQYLQSIHATP